MPDDFEDLPFDSELPPAVKAAMAVALAPVRAPDELTARIDTTIDELAPQPILSWTPKPSVDPTLRRYQKLAAAAAAIVLGLIYWGSLRTRTPTPRIRIVDVTSSEVRQSEAAAFALASSFDGDLVRPVHLDDPGAGLPFDLDRVERQFRSTTRNGKEQK